MKFFVLLFIALLAISFSLSPGESTSAQENALTVTPGPTQDFSAVFNTLTPVPADAWSLPLTLPSPNELVTEQDNSLMLHLGLVEGCLTVIESATILSCSPLQSTEEHPFSYTRFDSVLPRQALAGFGDWHYMAIDRANQWEWGGIDSLRPDIKALMSSNTLKLGPGAELLAPSLEELTGFPQTLNIVINNSNETVGVASVYPSSGSIDRFGLQFGQSWTRESVEHVTSLKGFQIIRPGRSTEFFNRQNQVDVATNVPNCTLDLEDIAVQTGANASMDLATFRATMAQFQGMECPGFNVIVVLITDDGPQVLLYGVYVRYMQPAWNDLSFVLQPGYDPFSMGVPSIPTVTPTATPSPVPTNG